MPKWLVGLSRRVEGQDGERRERERKERSHEPMVLVSGRAA